jgi:hypothetical protein
MIRHCTGVVLILLGSLAIAAQPAHRADLEDRIIRCPVFFSSALVEKNLSLACNSIPLFRLCT